MRTTPYLMAIGTVVLMAGLRFLLDPLLGEHYPFVLFLAAVFFSAWHGGWRVGSAALILGLSLANLLFIAPQGKLGSIEQTTGMVVYIFVSGSMIVLIERLRRSMELSRLHGLQLIEEIEGHHQTQAALNLAKAELERRVVQRTSQLEAAAGQLHEEAAARLNAEDRLRRLAAIVAYSEDAILLVSFDGHIVDWNLGAERLFGYSAAEIVGKHLLTLVADDDRDFGEQKLERLQQGKEVYPYEAVRMRKNGSRVAVSVRLSQIKNETGATIGFSLIYRDLTHSRRLEEQLRQAQKMEAVGQLAGGVAHDFNNLLTIISGYCDLILEELRPADSTRELIEEIRLAGERATTLTRQLLVFSRKGVLEPKIVDINEVVRGTETMLRRLIGEDIQLFAALADQLGLVKVDPGQVEQVIMNLAINARDAMPQGGRLTIETANVELDEGYAATHPEVWPGRYVLLAIGDTGTGMDEATKSRIFLPFFTTKGVGKGTGLGLAVVHGFIKQSGGHIAVYSEPGHGTSFKIYLPVVEGRKSEATPPVENGTYPKGNETILLVEDEEAVRKLSAQSLRTAGYLVLESALGREAIQIAAAFNGPIHLLVSDVVMPEMGGRILAERLAPARPAMKVLFVSGYADDAVVRHGVLEAEMPFLQKPFTPGALARKVREILDQ